MACSRSVLIIDDDVDVRETIAEVLQEEGWHVDLAADGREALGLLREGSAWPDLILLDLMMPVMDGWQFRALQRQDPVLGRVPTVLLSADSNLSQKAAALGAADYLQKPVEFDVLVQTVRKHLPA